MPYTDDAFRKKLDGMDSTQLSIQTLSRYMLLQRTQLGSMGSVWLSAFKEGTEDRKQLLFYLMNDVMHMGKKRHGSSVVGVVMPFVRAAASEISGTKNATFAKVVSIWKERELISPSSADAVLNVLGKKAPDYASAYSKDVFAALDLPLGVELTGDKRIDEVETGLKAVEQAELVMSIASDSRDRAITDASSAVEVSGPDEYEGTVPFDAEAKRAVLVRYTEKASEEIETRKSLISSMEALLEMTRGDLAK